MIDKLLHTIETMHEIARLDNRIIGNLEIQLKNEKTKVLEAMLAHDRCLDRFIALENLYIKVDSIANRKIDKNTSSGLAIYFVRFFLYLNFLIYLKLIINHVDV